MGKYRRAYAAGFKLQVVKYAEEHGKRAAGRKFDVDEKCVRCWCIQQKDIAETNRTRKAFRGKQCKFPKLEEELAEYVRTTRRDGYAVSTEMIRVKALAVARRMDIAPADFKASRGWLQRFMKRNQFSIRRRTTLCQKLPAEYEDQVVKFHRFVNALRRDHVYDLSQIGNADQTPVWFDAPENCTVDVKGAKSVSVRTTGAERQRCTVMLCVTADGRKLPPYVVFKRKTMPKEKFPQGIVVRVQEKGWMSDELVVDWLKTVWQNRPGALLHRKALLVLDSFRGHLTNRVKSRLADYGTDLAVIPGGLTSVLQPLDVCVNRPFKVEFRRCYSEWMAAGSHEKTPTGRLKRASLQQVCQWILNAWRSLSVETIVKSFKVTGISNAMDGTEDDQLWERADEMSSSGDDDSKSDDE